jgi:hypothetical protein
MKIFFLVIMPLISGGVLHGIARQFGISLPAVLRGKGGGFGERGSRMGADGYYGSEGYGGRRGNESGGLLDSIGGVGSLMKVAQAFI